jgi:hypothetical protein
MESTISLEGPRAEQTTSASFGSNPGIAVQVADTRLELDCAREDAVISRCGQDLVIVVQDVLELTVEGFFNNYVCKAA